METKKDTVKKLWSTPNITVLATDNVNGGPSTKAYQEHLTLHGTNFQIFGGTYPVTSAKFVNYAS